MILGIIEPYVEVLNLVLAFLAIVISIGTYGKLRGELKRAGKYLLFAVFLFGVHEIVGSLQEFGVFAVEGLYAFTELIFIVALLVSFFAIRKVFGGVSKK